MFRYNDRFDGRYINQFLHDLPIKPNTSYTVTFDTLGGAVGFWVNHCFTQKVIKPFYYDRCDTWTTRTVTFTTSNALQKQEAFSNWGLSFFKKMDSYYLTGNEDTYIDNVRLFSDDDPTVNLIDGGDFIDEESNDIYHKNWHPMFLGEIGKARGISLAPDPTNPANQCLLLPKRLSDIPRFEGSPFAVNGFGFYKEMPRSVFARALAFPILILVQTGTLIIDSETKITLTDGQCVLLTPDTVDSYVLKDQKNSSYYWLSFENDAYLRSTAEIVPLKAIEDRNIAAQTSLIDSMLDFPAAHPLYGCAVNGYAQILIAQLCNQGTPSVDSEQQKLIEQVQARLASDPQSAESNTALAESCGFSTGHFVRLFKQYTGYTPHQYLQRIKMQKAAKLLVETSTSVKEIALLLGIDNPLYFSNAFRRFYGISPREYRKQHHS